MFATEELSMKQSSGFVSRLIIAAVVLTASGIAAAQQKEPSSRPSESEAGFWPTRRMIDLFLERGADDIARRYVLGDEQREALIADMRQRWPVFLERHRKTIQPIMNEVIEMRLAGETPTPEKAAEWAASALP